MTSSFVLLANPSPRAIAGQLRELGREFRSWRPAFRAALPLLERGILANIDGRGRPIGETWPELAAATQRRKARMGRNRGPLIGTGKNLRGPIAAGGVVTITATTVRFAVAGLVANVQHRGSEKRKIPARPYMLWSPPMEAAMLAAFEAYAEQMLAKASAKLQALHGGRG